MDPGIIEFADEVEEVLRVSTALQRLGFSNASRTVCEQSGFLPAGCGFSFKPCKGRIIDVFFSYWKDGDGSCTVEIFNTTGQASFLLYEWMDLHGGEDNRRQFRLASYGGRRREKLEKFTSFLEQQLSSAALDEVLQGRSWVDIPYDWGNTK